MRRINNPKLTLASQVRLLSKSTVSVKIPWSSSRRTGWGTNKGTYCYYNSRFPISTKTNSIFKNTWLLSDADPVIWPKPGIFLIYIGNFFAPYRICIWSLSHYRMITFLSFWKSGMEGFWFYDQQSVSTEPTAYCTNIFCLQYKTGSWNT